MRLIASPDGTVDRYDRALWLTPPFDRAFAELVIGVFTLVTGEVYLDGPALADIYLDGTLAGEAYSDGVITGEVQPA